MARALALLLAALCTRASLAADFSLRSGLRYDTDARALQASAQRTCLTCTNNFYVWCGGQEQTCVTRSSSCPYSTCYSRYASECATCGDASASSSPLPSATPAPKPASCDPYAGIPSLACTRVDLGAQIKESILAAEVCLPLFSLLCAALLVWYAHGAPPTLLPGAVLQQADKAQAPPASPTPLPFADYASKLLLGASVSGSVTLLLTLASLGLPWVAITGSSSTPFTLGYFGVAIGLCQVGSCITLTPTRLASPLASAFAAAGLLHILAACAAAASTLLAATGGKAMTLVSTLPLLPSWALNLGLACAAAWAALALLALGLLVPLAAGGASAAAVEDLGLAGELITPGLDATLAALALGLVHAVLVTVAGAQSAVGAPAVLRASGLLCCIRRCGCACCCSNIGEGGQQGAAAAQLNPLALPLQQQPLLPRPGEVGQQRFAAGPIGLTFARRGAGWVVQEVRGQSTGRGLLEGDEVLSVEGEEVGAIAASAEAPGGIPGVLGPASQGPITVVFRYSSGAAERGRVAYNTCEALRKTSRVKKAGPLRDWVVAVISAGRALHSAAELHLMRNAVAWKEEQERAEREALLSQRAAQLEAERDLLLRQRAAQLEAELAATKAQQGRQ